MAREKVKKNLEHVVQDGKFMSFEEFVSKSRISKGKFLEFRQLKSILGKINPYYCGFPPSLLITSTFVTKTHTQALCLSHTHKHSHYKKTVNLHMSAFSNFCVPGIVCLFFREGEAVGDTLCILPKSPPPLPFTPLPFLLWTLSYYNI